MVNHSVMNFGEVASFEDPKTLLKLMADILVNQAEMLVEEIPEVTAILKFAVQMTVLGSNAQMTMENPGQL